MRRLADRLGVAPNALYSHFPDKSALLDAFVDSVLAEVEVPDLNGMGWRQGLIELMGSSRRLLLAHCDVLPFIMSRPTRGPEALRLGEQTLSLLERAGLEGEQAVEALRILLTFTFGFAAQEAPRRADPEGERRLAENEAAFAAARDRPRMRELAVQLARHPGDETFESGLRWLLDGIGAAGGDAVDKRRAPANDDAEHGGARRGASRDRRRLTAG
jgi:AcrR family transcriptional regulator